eukprot:7389930-Prymnesium_polylepis.3
MLSPGDKGAACPPAGALPPAPSWVAGRAPAPARLAPGECGVCLCAPRPALGGAKEIFGRGRTHTTRIP